jgi:hypothetical protein
LRLRNNGVVFRLVYRLPECWYNWWLFNG